jgi:FkbM family methyltransferase
MNKLGRLVSTIKRLFAARHNYINPSDWFYSFYHRLLQRFPALQRLARSRVRRVRLAGTKEPFYVRSGTTDWYMLEEIFIDKTYEPVLRQGLGDVKTVIDLGANVGFSVRLWQQSYPLARIICVEPDVSNLQLCQQNVRSGGQPGPVVFVQACVAGKARRVSLDRSGGASRCRIQDNVSSGEYVDAITLTQLLERTAITGFIDLLKCDIEGAEAEVFADCRAWIRRVRNLVIELHSPYSRQQLLQDLRSGGGEFEVTAESLGAEDTTVLFLRQAEVFSN